MLTVSCIALGANLPSGDNPPIVTLARAFDILFNDNVLEVARSRFYETPAFPDPAAPAYINACVSVQTTLSAKALLDHLHAVETQLGRLRAERWGARIIDLDLISFGAVIHPDMTTYETWAALPPEQQVARTPDQMILPHPRIADRGFVLVPLAEIAPRWRHPVTGVSVKDLLEQRPKAEIDAIRPLEAAQSACQA